ncbi:MAG: DUF2142 domain-containing protein [Lachnospiraceae bacterium]|nr:DUF2142 domain-containing protein [Lachnospiraceae bacterium]
MKLFGNRENTRKKLSYKMLLLVLAIVLAGFAVDLFCQRQVVFLPEEEKGTFAIDVGLLNGLGIEKSEEGIRFTGEEGVMTLNLDGNYVDRFAIRYDCSQRLDLMWTVWMVGEEVPLIIEDSNSVFIDTTVENLNGYVEQIDLYCRQNEYEPYSLILKELSIINEYQISWHRILFVWVLLSLLAFLWLGREWISGHVAQAYLIAALSMGSLMILLTPANKVSWDEEVHFFHAYCVSHFGAEVKTNDILEKLFVADEENWPYSVPVNVDERMQMNAALNELVEDLEYTHNRGRALAGIYTPAYVPSAVGIRLGLLCGLPFTAVYQLGRLANLVFCALVMAWAIHKIPVGKAVLAMIGLLPTPLFLMAMYSYDSFITALFALGFAIFLDEYMHRERKISWWSFWIMALGFAVGSMPKAIYVPLILIVWLLPKEKFISRKQEWWMKGISTVLFAALMASFVLPVIISPAETNDIRGGNTSEAGQIPYILSDIPRFIDMMVYSIRTTFAGFTIGAPVYGSVGHLGLEMLGMLLPLFVLAVIFMDEKCLEDGPELNGGHITRDVPGQRLTWPARLWTLLMCLAVIGMVWVAMYLAFTPVGYDHVNGVQARYYIPLLLPIYLCLCPDRVRVPVEKKWLYELTLGGCVAITMMVVARSMLSLCV